MTGPVGAAAHLSNTRVSTSTATLGASLLTAWVRAMQGRSSLRLTGNTSPSRVSTSTALADLPLGGLGLQQQ